MAAAVTRYDLLKPRLRRFTRLLPELEEGAAETRQPARAAARRLRELVPILQLEAASARRIDARLGKMTRRIGRIRDLDVQLALVEDLEREDVGARRALQEVRDDLLVARSKSHVDTLARKAAADGRRVARWLDETLQTLRKSPDEASRTRAVAWVLKARVARRAATLKTAIADAGWVYVAARLHATRLALKKLRYAVELLAETVTVAPADQRMLERTQELLGRLHDAQVLSERIHHVQSGLARSDRKARLELDALNVTLENRCRNLHARYVREREALIALCDRLHARSGSASSGAIKAKPARIGRRAS